MFINMLYNLVTKSIKRNYLRNSYLKIPKYNISKHAFILQELFFGDMCLYNWSIRDKRFTICFKNQYPHVIGKIVEVDKTSHGDFSVIIENEITKEKLDIGFIHKNLKEGEKVEVYYLPHLKIGSIYKIQQ